MKQPQKADEASCSGCVQLAVVAPLLVWLGAVPLGVTLVVEATMRGRVSQGVVDTTTIAITAALLLIPLVVITLFLRRQAEWQSTTAAAAGLAAAAGYLTLDAAVRALPLQEETATAAVRLGVLGAYALLAAWLTPRLAGAPRRRLWEWLGLDRFSLSTLLVALATSALFTIPWPVTGSLGDALTSLDLTWQTLTWAIPQVLVFWGVIFCLLTSMFSRPWTAGLMMFPLYAVSQVGGILPNADWGELQNTVILLPLAFLLTELRARGSGVYPLLPAALCYRVVPSLFVDPRDVVAKGFPEPGHLLSHFLTVVVTAVIAAALWGGRWILRSIRDRVDMPVRVRLPVAIAALLLLWSLWAGLYVYVGEPGFANDGFLIILEEQADLSAAYTIPDREPRSRYVYETLVATAERTQAPLCAELDELGVPYRPYYIINMIRVDGHRWLMGHFEGRPGVAQVILNPNVREYPGSSFLLYEDEYDQPPAGIQSNLTAIHADEAWALEVTGAGIVVAGQDTGYDWTHPALQSHYRGWDGQNAHHDYNWHDAWDYTPVPFDDDLHGTHTMGIVLGDDGSNNHTGVAPGAQWIGCRNMRRGFGNPGAYAECMEFFLAPYPHDGDPFTDGDVRLAPHVINNSWGCPDFEGCFSNTLEPAVEALRAAGIMMVVSAGNDGPACGTAITPPANYDAVFSVGAANDNGEIVYFSSRGPVDGQIKPDIVAPGYNVRSSIPGDRYDYNSGTSMAGPHVAGLVALIWSANPDLIGDIDATEMLICRTATPKLVETLCTVPSSGSDCACGDVTGVPNNVYGCGLIDAGAAVRAALEH